MMIEVSMLGLNSQRLIEAGFATALLASLLKRHWVYAIFLTLALAEAHASTRYGFHSRIRDLLLGNPPSAAAKYALQSTLVYTVGALGLVAALILLPFIGRASAWRLLMAAGTGIVLAILALELISPHNIDAFLYHPAGPFTRSAIAYFAGAIFIALGALMTPRRPKPAG